MKNPCFSVKKHVEYTYFDIVIAATEKMQNTKRFKFEYENGVTGEIFDFVTNQFTENIKRIENLNKICNWT